MTRETTRTVEIDPVSLQPVRVESMRPAGVLPKAGRLETYVSIPDPSTAVVAFTWHTAAGSWTGRAEYGRRDGEAVCTRLSLDVPSPDAQALRAAQWGTLTAGCLRAYAREVASLAAIRAARLLPDGVTIPEPTAAAPVESRRWTHADLRAAAAAYRTALDAGESCGVAVAHAMGTNANNARQIIARCRSLGILPPAPAPRTRGERVGDVEV
jgi:hypothetical protein